MPACGKEEFLKLAQSKGFAVVRMGDIVREEAANAGISVRDPDVGNFANEERKKHGFDIWAKRTLPRISSGLSLVDGVRGPAEIAVYRAAFPNGVCVVAVHSSPGTRLRRMMMRRRKDDPANEEEFRKRDARELSWGLGEVIALADHVLVNEGDLTAYRIQATATIEKMISEGK
jgi:dephospho-CoA kinase